MLRNKNGVTLTILAVSIIVMFILFGITMSVGTELLKRSNVTRTESNLLLVKVRAENRLENYLFDETNTNYASLLGIDDVTAEQKAIFTEKPTGTYIYRRWDSNKLEEEGIDTSEIASGENFIVQYNTANDEIDVATTKVVTDEDNVTYTKLSDFN